MRDDVETINRCHASPFAIGQPQPAPYGLLNQCARIGRTQRHDCVEVGDVPALFEHVDVYDDLGRLVHALYREEACDHLFLLRARTAGVDLNHLALIAPFVEGN